MDKNQKPSKNRKLNCDDASKCFELLESILDGEETSASKEILDEKLAKCQPCFEHYHLRKGHQGSIQNQMYQTPGS
jgi:predicted anti-sigma-YlaC factor YlaD